MDVPTRPLGTNGPQVPRLGLGLMGLSAHYGPKKPDSERMALLDAAWKMGERYWDSADIYDDNEDLLGRWFAANPEKRKDIFLVTKFANGVRAPTQAERDSGEADTVASKMKRRFIDSSPEYAQAACEESLRRLSVDHIDLYYVHRVDGKTPIERTMEGLVALKQAGKIRHIGLSEVTADTVRRAHAVHPVAALQTEYSPWELSVESEQTRLLATCRELGIAFVPYSPLGRGILTGTLRSPDDFGADDVRAMLPRYSRENFSKNLALVDKLAAAARAKGVTTTQLVLAWVLAQGDDFFPIPGTTRVDRLEENFGALKVQLTAQEEKDLRKTINDSAIFGLRYPEAALHTIYGQTPPLDA